MRDSQGTLIDLAGWKRREHFQLFRNSAQPFFSVTLDVDVTSLWRRSLDDPDMSFAVSALFLLLRATNASEPLRLRVRGESVWRHHSVGVGTTVLRSDETFGFARLDLTPAYEDFRKAAQATIESAKHPGALEPTDNDDVVYHSTLPWLRFTSFTNALSRMDSIPRIVFGKVSAEGAAYRMPMAVEVHHALVDGLDVARFVEDFQSEVARFA